MANAQEWLTAAVECDICGREWVAVWPIGAERLECPGCGHMNAAPPEPYPAEFTDDDQDDDDSELAGA